MRTPGPQPAADAGETNRSELTVDADTAVFGREYAVGWGTLALINAALAQTKNRSPLAWFLVSLFLGPIATLAIVLVDKVPEAPAKE